MFWLASEREGQGLPVVCCPPRRLLGWGEQTGTDVAWSTLSDRRIRFSIIIANIYYKIKIFTPQIWAGITMKNSIISWYQMLFLTSSSILIIFFRPGHSPSLLLKPCLTAQATSNIVFFWVPEGNNDAILMLSCVILQTWLCSSLKAGPV